MGVYWAGTGVTLDHHQNEQGDEWFSLCKNGVEIAQLDNADLCDARVFDAFTTRICQALRNDEAALPGQA